MNFKILGEFSYLSQSFEMQLLDEVLKWKTKYEEEASKSKSLENDLKSLQQSNLALQEQLSTLTAQDTKHKTEMTRDRSLSIGTEISEGVLSEDDRRNFFF